MTNKIQQKISLRPYYTAGFPLLVLMGVIILVGLGLTAALHFI